MSHALQAALAGQAFSVVLPAADADSGNGGPYEYALLNRADNTAFSANGLSFDAATRTLSGTPTAEGTHELTYRVHDSDGNRADTDAFIDKTNLKVVVVPGGNVVGDTGPEESNSETEPANEAPSFAASSATREVAENSGGGVNVGSPVTAADLERSLLALRTQSFDLLASSAYVGETSTACPSPEEWQAIVDHRLERLREWDAARA